jgi:hypothetical protein
MTTPRLLFLLLMSLACTGLGIGVVAVSQPSKPAPPAGVVDSRPVSHGPVAVLRDWDRRRAAAWTSGDLAGLRALYVTGSVAGERDVVRLRAWVERGARVRRLETQVLRARVLARGRGRWVLSVTDRVARAVVTGGVRLPEDGPSTWRIAMQRVAGEWRVASVRR